MNINDLTIGQAKELAAQFQTTGAGGDTTGPFEVNKNYFIRTATHAQTGRLVAAYPNELVLTNAAWIADTGRFADALVSCDFNEVEPFPANRRVIIGRNAIIDAVQIDKLPTEQK